MLETLLTILFSVAAVIVLCVGMAQMWRWVYASSTCQDETAFIRASDGWRLALHRYRPENVSGCLPIILCHGLGGNRYSFDLPGAPSLARFLKEHGRDVWVLELRGSGLSDQPGVLRSDVPRSWSFDDHLTKDVGAAIDYVLAHTGAAAVHWIGHSMGGMLGLSSVAAEDHRLVATVITLGSPLDFSRIPPRIFAILLSMKSLLRLFPLVPTGIVARIAIPVLAYLPPYVQGLYHGPNIDPATARRIVALGSQSVMSSQLWLDFGRFLETGAFARGNGAPYVDLEKSSMPVLSIAGSADLLAPPAAARPPCSRSSVSGESTYCVIGKDSGCTEDYGHMDLLLGVRAEQEVYPLIADWLDSHEEVGVNSARSGTCPSRKLEVSVRSEHRASLYGTGTGIPNGPGNGCQTGVKSGN